MCFKINIIRVFVFKEQLFNEGRKLPSHLVSASVKSKNGGAQKDNASRTAIQY